MLKRPNIISLFLFVSLSLAHAVPYREYVWCVSRSPPFCATRTHSHSHKHKHTLTALTIMAKLQCEKRYCFNVDSNKLKFETRKAVAKRLLESQTIRTKSHTTNRTISRGATFVFSLHICGDRENLDFCRFFPIFFVVRWFSQLVECFINFIEFEPILHI